MKNISRLIVLGVILSLLFSCNERGNTRDDFGRYAFKLLRSKANASGLFSTPTDSLWLAIYGKSFDSIQHEEQVTEWRKKAKFLNINWFNSRFIKIESKTIYSIFYTDQVLKVYFTVNGNEYFFFLNGVSVDENRWASRGVSSPTNKEDYDRKRNAELNMPFKHSGLSFSGCNYEWLRGKPKTFSNFYITLDNILPIDFKKVKFIVSISTIKDGYKTKVFSRTIEKEETVFANDVIRYEILELKDFYLGVNISDKNSFVWDAEIIDARPTLKYEETVRGINRVTSASNIEF